MTPPEERPASLASALAPAWNGEDAGAHDVMHRMENILVKELPRVADMMGSLMRGMEERLDEAMREIARLREAQQALERQHADDEARLSELDALRRQNAEFAAKLDAVADLKRAISRL